MQRHTRRTERERIESAVVRRGFVFVAAGLAGGVAGLALSTALFGLPEVVPFIVLSWVGAACGSRYYCGIRCSRCGHRYGWDVRDALPRRTFLDRWCRHIDACPGCGLDLDTPLDEIQPMDGDEAH